MPGDHDKRVADLLELVQLTGLGDRYGATAAAADAGMCAATAAARELAWRCHEIAAAAGAWHLVSAAGHLPIVTQYITDSALSQCSMAGYGHNVGGGR